MKSNGYLRLDWARTHMNVSSSIREKFLEEKPFKGLKVGMALHVEAKTGIFPPLALITILFRIVPSTKNPVATILLI